MHASTRTRVRHAAAEEACKLAVWRAGRVATLWMVTSCYELLPSASEQSARWWETCMHKRAECACRSVLRSVLQRGLPTRPVDAETFAGLQSTYTSSSEDIVYEARENCATLCDCGMHRECGVSVLMQGERSAVLRCGMQPLACALAAMRCQRVGVRGRRTDRISLRDTATSTQLLAPRRCSGSQRKPSRGVVQERCRDRTDLHAPIDRLSGATFGRT